MQTTAIDVPKETTPVYNPVIQSISVAGDGSVWAVDNTGAVLQNTDNVQPWTPMPAPPELTPSWVSVNSEANVVCAVMNGAPMYLLMSPGQIWGPLGTLNAQLKTIEVGMISSTGYAVWATDDSNNVWAAGLKGQWTSLGVTADAVAATSDGAVYRLDKGLLYQLNPDSSWGPITASEALVGVGAGAQGWLWTVGTSGTVYQYDGSQGWQSFAPPNPNPPGSISCGDDTTVWLLSGQSLFQFDPTTGGWDPIGWSADAPASAAEISVGSREEIWATDTAGNMYQYTEHLDSWGSTGITGVQQVAAASETLLWAVEPPNTVVTLTLSGGSWQPSPSLGEQSWVSVGSDGTVWGVSGGNAYQYSGSAWQQQSSTPSLTAVSAGSAGQIAALDAAGTAYAWVSSTTSWQALPATSTADPLVSVSMTAAGALWAVGKSGLLYLWLDQWLPGPPSSVSFAQVSGISPDDLWAIDVSGNAYDLSTDDPSLEAAPAKSRLPGWDTETPFFETWSTHLWIVNRAATVAQLQGPTGQQIFNLVKPFQGKIGDDGFHDNLLQGLYDADFLPQYNNPVHGITTYASHFYDPDSQTNWMGQSTPTAYDQSVRFFYAALSAYQSPTGKLADAGYNLGLALHYLTDLTQPMHAANFAWQSSGPMPGYHSSFEGYVMEIQNQVTAPNAYVPSTSGADPRPLLLAVARNSKTKYYDNICPHWAFWNYYGFTGYYQNIAQSNVNGMLTDAITFTSQYLVAWMQAATAIAEISLATDPNELRQMCSLDVSGTLWHQTWPSGGTPSGWESVAEKISPDCGPKTAVACTSTRSLTLFVFVIADNTVLYATRAVDGTWSTTWQPVPSTFSPGPPQLSSIDCTVDGLGHVQVTVLDSTGTLWHTLQASTGSWQVSWGNVNSVESNSFGANAVACAGDSLGGLHVLAIQASNGAQWYTYRDANGSWPATWTPLSQFVTPAKAMTAISSAVDSSGTLQIAGLDTAGTLWHTIRPSSGTWSTSWGLVSGQVANTRPLATLSLGAYANLWICGVDNNGVAAMAERYPTGSWYPSWLVVGQPPS